MSFETAELPLLTIQELRTAEAPQLYRPHTSAKPKAFDWDALTPTCKNCGTKTGEVNSTNGLCPGCDPAFHYEPEEPAPAPSTVRPAAQQPRRAPKPPRTPREPRTARPAPRPVGRPRIPVDVDAVIEAYTGGQTIPGIATALGVGWKRIHDTLVENDVELRNDRGRHWAARTCEHGVARNGATCPTCREARNAARRTGRPRGHSGRPLDEPAIVADYLAGNTTPQLAEKYETTPKRIRNIVRQHGHPLRDDRATRSGRRTKNYDPQLVEQIRRLYLDERLSQSKIALRIGTSTKVVQTVMDRHQIPARQGETGRIDGAAGLKAQIRDLGVPIQEIKAWALRQGLIFEIAPGIPPRRVVDAYTDAHQDGAA